MDQAAWVQNQYKALAAEAEYALEAVGGFRDVQAQYMRIINFILVKIRFNTPRKADGMDEEFALNNLAQRYMIEGLTGSILSAKNAQDYSTLTGRIANFSAVIANWGAHLDCAVQLILF